MRTTRAAAIALGVLLSATASRADNILTVVVFDYARTPHELLVSAIKEGRHAFRTTGIETQWILCHPTQGCHVPDRYVQVKILPRPLASTPVSSRGLAATVECASTEDCAASYVFSDRVLAFADECSSPVDLTLGYVMAHEIGHQMGLGHRPNGIMAASFTLHDLQKAASGSLLFAADDARELRAAIARSPIAGTPPHLIRLHGQRAGIAE
jgi:hypothetical protein